MKGTLWTNVLAVPVAVGGAVLHFYVGFTYPSCHTNDVCFYLVRRLLLFVMCLAYRR